MNKELILKFKKEFDHWLHGGKILHKNEVSEAWWLDDCWSCPTEFIHAVIINDDYVELRKALAEGKTIQCRSYTTEEWIGFNKGFEPTPSYTFLTVPEYYRVKPEGPKFKTGDWIKQGNYTIKVHRMDSDYYYDKSNGCIAIDKAEKWEPKRGELCWFWTPAKNLIPKLGKFLQMEAHNQYYASFGSGNYDCASYLCCEPFIGELPEYVKELNL